MSRQGVGAVVRAKGPIAGLYDGEWFLYAFPGCHGIVTQVLEGNRIRVSWEPQGSGRTDIHRNAVVFAPDAEVVWRVIDTDKEQAK